MRIALILPLAGALALTACSKSASDEAPVANEAENESAILPTDEPTPVNNIVETPEPANATPEAAPAPKVSDNEQMLDDADATGLTTRISQDSGQNANEARPAE